MPKILIVDDDPSGTRLLITLLGFEGYEGIELQNWTDPLADVERERPDLVIMDVRLLLLNGIAVLRRLRAHPQPEVAATPVLMMSAEDHSVRCAEAGADGFVEKPFECGGLLEQIEKLIGGGL